ncbi:MAG: hypothetical protein ACUZ8N_03370 [Candidatus Scalindua sp.]
MRYDSITVIGGLLFSTLLTLVSVVYDIVEKIKESVSGREKRFDGITG